VREWLQIEATTAETKTKNQNEKMNQETKILKAATLGTIAFKAGKKRIPALDKNLLALFAGEIGSSVVLMKAWITSWDAANIAA